MKPTLVVMAAGMGSRFGGLKQMEPIGPNGELIIDYSIYDAINAGFGKVIFIVKKELVQTFRDCIGDRLSKYIDIEYVYQEIENVPEGINFPPERTKPWGTAHAVLSCKNIVKTPFAVINADDFYGKSAFTKLAEFLTCEHDEIDSYKYCMIGFKLSNTLTENGHVARGVCKSDENGYLIEIVERTHIEKREDMAVYSDDEKTFHPLDINSLVSMNTWGFSQSIFGEIERNFTIFFTENKNNLLKAEFFLPSVVDILINSNKAKVSVLSTDQKWYGVTYKEDKKMVVSAIANLVANGKYPNNLWSDFING